MKSKATKGKYNASNMSSGGKRPGTQSKQPHQTVALMQGPNNSGGTYGLVAGPSMGTKVKHVTPKASGYKGC